MSTALSVITCDLEGRIETFNEAAQKMFGYSAEDVIGKKRVSLFSPGLVVLEHVGQWLATAQAQGKYEGDTVFVRQDGTRFAAHIRITPTFKHGQQIGYCGVTQVLPDISPERAMPAIRWTTRVFAALVVTRAPFLAATILPMLFAGAYVAATSAQAFQGGNFAWALLGAIALHISANTFNDYFDWKSGTDQANNDYFLPFSGGSRSIELGLISLPQLATVAWCSLAVATLAGLALTLRTGLGIVAFGLVGAFAAYFYTAPPLRLAARRGLGELFVGLCFGPLLVAGTIYALTQTIDWRAFAVGLPLGLLTTAILWVNEFPDAPSDAQTGKNHLVVVLGKKNARWGFIALLAAAFILMVAFVSWRWVPVGALLGLLPLPLAVKAATTVIRRYQERDLVTANKWTIQLQAAVAALSALGCFVQSLWPLSR